MEQEVQERLRNEMSEVEVIEGLCSGHEGSIMACKDLLKYTERTDPDNARFRVEILYYLDELGIWDERIYKLWKDVCHKKTSRMFFILWAYQLEELDREKIGHAIDNKGKGIDIILAIAQVKDRMPDLNYSADL